MAKERIIHLTGGISEWNISHNYMKYMMDELGEGPITVKCTSPGGDLNQALMIKALFEQHGDVTVEYIGFNASAATIIGHGAAKTVIREDSFYLVHKPSVWIDTWGRLNADEIADAIQELEKQKLDAEKFTLSMALDYVNSRGITMEVVEKLMKEARWLTAAEAVELGLIDELLPSKNKKAAVTSEILAMMSANGYPVPELTDDTQADSPKPGIIQTIINSISPKKQIQMNKDFVQLNQVLAVEGVEMSEGKVTLTLEQITAINARLQDRETALATATTERDNAVQGRTTAETALSDFTALVNQIDPTVASASDATAKVAAINAKLAQRPAAAPATPQGSSGANDHQTEADFDTIDSLPHNQAADREIY